MEFNAEEVNLQVHNLPAVIMMECQLPKKIIKDLNTYLDVYKKDKDRKSLSHTLVGQIHQGEQLLMDHNDDMLKEYYRFITNMGVIYLQSFSDVTGHYFNNKIVDIDELWSVHSYEGDYNPIHDHGTKTITGISTTTWTKVPKQIGKMGEARLDREQTFSLFKASGACDGFLAFTYGRNQIMDVQRLRPPQSISMQPKVGRQLIFPSWMQHMVYPFFGKGERRTVAANLNVWDTEPQGEKNEQ
tara:strand:+ start:131 stop:859 length:729 start_codon:yes stop_codon:yes gene_type:complete